MVNKKIIYLLIALAVIGGLAIAIYFIFFNKGVTQKEVNVTKLINSSIQDPIVDEKGENILYFNLSEDKELAFYSFNITNKTENKITDELDVPDRVIWSPKRDKAILKVTYDKTLFEKFNSKFRDDSILDLQETTWLFEFSTQKLTRLNLNIQNVSWFDNDRILYHYYEPGGNANSIAISNADGQNWEKLTDVNFNEGAGIGRLSNDEIYYFPVAPEKIGNKIYKLNLNTKQITQIVKNNAGRAIASPDSSKVAFEIYHRQSFGYTLGLVNKDGTNNTDLGLETEIRKSGLVRDNLIVARLQAGKTTDQFFNINLGTGQVEGLKLKTSDAIQAENVILNPKNNDFYFISNKALYQASY